MSLSVSLPLFPASRQQDGGEARMTEYTLKGDPLPIRPPTVKFNRLVYAAPHLIIRPLATRSPTYDKLLPDWDATLSFRRYLWSLGFGIAEAMDTSQRGMGLNWELAKELIGRTIKEAKAVKSPPSVVCGAGTDHLPADTEHSKQDIIAAYLHQTDFVEDAGGGCVLMASHALARTARTAADYRFVYDGVLRRVSAPVILHWLGEVFDARLKNYWSANTDLDQALDSVTEIIVEHRAKVAGIKISLLDEELEIRLRSRLPAGVRLFTGDDFNYPSLIKGDAAGYSDALLGVFSAIAPAASLALEALASDKETEYDRLMESTLDLARELFATPTQFYKAGIGFLAWLNGSQPHFIMPAGLQAMRSICHYARLFCYADRAGLLADPPLAVKRMRHLLALHGCGD